MKMLLFVYFTLLILAVSSCQKSGQEATVSGMNSCTTNPASCNGSLYQQNSGFSPYGQNTVTNYNQPFNYYNNTAYLCNCPLGAVPTYNSYTGLGCASTYPNTYYYNMGWNSHQWSYSAYLSTYSYNQSTCYSGAVRSCLLAYGYAACPSGYYCRANGGSTTLGLCSSSYR